MIDTGTLSESELRMVRRHPDPEAAKARKALALQRKQEVEQRKLQAQARRQQRAKQKAEAERERATAKKLRAQQRAVEREPAGFNAVEFHQDLMAAARGLGITRRTDLAKDAGVREQAIADLRKGLAPTLATVLVLCDWAGMNPLQYLMRMAPAAANDSAERAAA